MKLAYSGLTDVGSIRDNNEDYQYAGKINDNDFLFVVADGMGGHNAGEIASRTAVTQLICKLEEAEGENWSQDDFKFILTAVNEHLFNESKKISERGGMGTTLSVLYIRDDIAYIAHIGDSRIYVYDPSESLLTQLTEDHSFVGKLLKDGLISEEEARYHPRRNVIYQSMGTKQEINLQMLPPIKLQEGLIYMLCSDGLHGVVEDWEISDLLDITPVKESAKELVKRANFNGGPDNIAVVVVAVGKIPKKKVKKRPHQRQSSKGDPFDVVPDVTQKEKIMERTAEQDIAHYLSSHQTVDNTEAEPEIKHIDPITNEKPLKKEKKPHAGFTGLTVDSRLPSDALVEDTRKFPAADDDEQEKGKRKHWLLFLLTLPILLFIIPWLLWSFDHLHTQIGAAAAVLLTPAILWFYIKSTIIPEVKIEIEPDDETPPLTEPMNTIPQNPFSGSISILIKGKDAGTFDLESKPTTIGRDPRVCTLEVRCEIVSKLHLEIIPINKKYFIRDLKSTNGTYINDKKIAEAYVNPGDTVQLGKRGAVKLIFRD